jgi:hypothetical protein
MALAPPAGAVCTTSELVGSLRSLTSEDAFFALMGKNEQCAQCISNCFNLFLARAQSLSCLAVECGGGSVQCAAKCVLAADYKSCAMACPGGGSGPPPLTPLPRLPSRPSPVSPPTPRDFTMSGVHRARRSSRSSCCHAGTATLLAMHRDLRVFRHRRPECIRR